MKTYKEFINKEEPVELDEAIGVATLGGIALWKILAGGGLAATAYANRERIGKTFNSIFNRNQTIDDLDKLNNFWRDTKTNNDTKIGDGIGTDVINPGALDTKTEVKPTDTKTDTEVGAGTQTQTQTQTINPAIAGAKSMSIAKAETNARRIKPFNIRKLPKLPGTGHNVGKRVNPQ